MQRLQTAVYWRPCLNVPGLTLPKDSKIRHLMVRDSGIKDIACVEKISKGKVLATLKKCHYQITPKQRQYDCLEVDELWTFVGKKTNKQWHKLCLSP